MMVVALQLFYLCCMLNRKIRGESVLFNSLTFIVFFTIVLILHQMPFSWRIKKLFFLSGDYFEYHLQLQGFRTPEWSHLHSDDAPVYTANLVPILDQKLKAAGKLGIIKQPCIKPSVIARSLRRGNLMTLS